jgi:hypothetical protein
MVLMLLNLKMDCKLAFYLPILIFAVFDLLRDEHYSQN